MHYKALTSRVNDNFPYLVTVKLMNAAVSEDRTSDPNLTLANEAVFYDLYPPKYVQFCCDAWRTRKKAQEILQHFPELDELKEDYDYIQRFFSLGSNAPEAHFIKRFGAAIDLTFEDVVTPFTHFLQNENFDEIAARKFLFGSLSLLLLLAFDIREHCIREGYVKQDIRADGITWASDRYLW